MQFHDLVSPLRYADSLKPLTARFSEVPSGESPSLICGSRDFSTPIDDNDPSILLSCRIICGFFSSFQSPLSLNTLFQVSLEQFLSQLYMSPISVERPSLFW
uniref:Uncharacterized protein n=1 Tax=Spongospora subterranea TaxID=70186 RepID=A0A0H5RDK7_9EUKA|eukprot:CRZ06639.1 hypothetical protein [Spongospora subterranea]